MTTAKTKPKAVKTGTYLIFADKTEEFPVALHYAAKLARAHDAHPAIIRVVEPHDFTHWGNIESRMRQEMRMEAEQIVWQAARDIYDLTGTVPSVYIEEGSGPEALVEVIQKDPTIKMLILAADTSGSNPGPLTSYFTTGKGLSRLRVPVLVIPSHVPLENIETLV